MHHLFESFLSLAGRRGNNTHRKEVFSLSSYIDNTYILPENDTITLGTNYGGWTIPRNSRLSENSICYLAGAGEDISFDCELAKRFRSTIRIFDPTPRAIEHFERLSAAVQHGASFPINGSETQFYQIDLASFQRLSFTACGLADRDGEIKLFSPKDPNHASYSALNLQHTDTYITVPCRRLSTLMKQNNELKIDLLKIDIEGGEYMVIGDMVSTRVFPTLLLIEFDEAHSALDSHAQDRIVRHLNLLIKAGYKCVAAGNCNATFLYQ